LVATLGFVSNLGPLGSWAVGACIDVTDRACLDVCPVDAIFVDRTARADETKAVFVTDSIAFFADILPGRDSALGDPGGAATVGEVGIDTPLVSAYEFSAYERGDVSAQFRLAPNCALTYR
jgi:hypothetical protein